MSSIRPDSQMSGPVTSGLRARGWEAAKLWLVAPTQTAPHVQGHMGTRMKDSACSSLLKTPCRWAWGWSLYSKNSPGFMAPWLERALGLHLCSSIPMQAVPTERSPGIAHPSGFQLSRERCLPLPHESPLCSAHSHLAIPFYGSAPWSPPRETSCSPPRPGPMAQKVLPG